MGKQTQGRTGAFPGKTAADWKTQLSAERGLARSFAAANLGECGPAAVPALIEALKHTDSDVRYWAAKGLGKAGAEAKEAIAALTGALQDPSESVRVAAAGALWRLGEKKAGLAGLIAGCRAESAAVRLAALNALALVGPEAKETIPALRVAAELKSNDSVQDYAVRKAGFVLKLLGEKQDLIE